MDGMHACDDWIENTQQHFEKLGKHSVVMQVSMLNLSVIHEDVMQNYKSG